jgi:hypothetical protein
MSGLPGHKNSLQTLFLNIFEMKTKISGRRTTKSLSVTVPAELVPEIDRAAKAQGRTRSSFLAWLILKQKMIDQI